MNNRKIVKLMGIGLLLFAMVGVTSAHFTMLFPGEDMDVTALDYIAKEGENKVVWIAWGHPCEHVLFDCPVVPEVYVRDPDGVTTDLSPSEITVEGVKAYKVSFTVEKRGDYIIHAKLNVPDHELVDHTKAIIHCGEEEWHGWDAKLGEVVETVPYARPYGMEAGFVFSGKALYEGEPLSEATVEVEKYYTKPDGDKIVEAAESTFPNDPPMMFTRVVKTNGNGDFAYTLDEPGIWFVGAYHEGEEMEERGVIIVPVLDAFLADGTETVAETVSVTSPEALENLPSNTLEYSAIGIAIIALLIGIVAIFIKKNR